MANFVVLRVVKGKGTNVTISTVLLAQKLFSRTKGDKEGRRGLGEITMFSLGLKGQRGISDFQPDHSCLNLNRENAVFIGLGLVINGVGLPILLKKTHFIDVIKGQRKEVDFKDKDGLADGRRSKKEKTFKENEM